MTKVEYICIKVNTVVFDKERTRTDASDVLFIHLPMTRFNLRLLNTYAGDSSISY